MKVGERPIPAKASGPDAGGGPAAGSLADALEQAIATARAGQLEQLDEDVDLQQLLDNAATGGEPVGKLRRGARDRAADRAAARPWRRPAAVPRRGAARPPLRHPAAPGDHAGDAADRQAHPGRAVRRPRVRPRPRRAGRRATGQHPSVARHPPGRRADPGAARRADHRHVRVDGRLRVRARADRLDPHRRAAPDRRAVRDRPVRQQRRRCSPTAQDRSPWFPGSAPAAAPRSPATQSSSSQTSSR